MKLTHMSSCKEFNDSVNMWRPPSEPRVTLSMKSYCTKCLMWIATSCGNTQGVFNVCVVFSRHFDEYECNRNA